MQRPWGKYELGMLEEQQGGAVRKEWREAGDAERCLAEAVQGLGSRGKNVGV